MEVNLQGLLGLDCLAGRDFAGQTFHIRDAAPVLQYQLVQHDSQNIEMRLVVERKLTLAEEGRLQHIVHGALGHPFTIRFTYFPGNIPRGAGGKFEEFMCLVSPDLEIS